MKNNHEQLLIYQYSLYMSYFEVQLTLVETNKCIFEYINSYFTEINDLSLTILLKYVSHPLCLTEILMTNNRIHQMKKNQTFKVVNVMILHFDVDRRLAVSFEMSWLIDQCENV